jgi:signal transduction histidine kinase
MLQHSGTLLSDASFSIHWAWASISAPIFSALLMVAAYVRHRRVRDIAFAFLLLAWLLRQYTQLHPLDFPTLRMTAISLCLGALLVISASSPRSWRPLLNIVGLLLAVSIMGGLALPTHPRAALLVWQVVHFGTGLVLLWHVRGGLADLPYGLTALVGAGLGLLALDIFLAQESRMLPPVISALYCAAVFGIWLTSTGRLVLGRERFRRATDALGAGGAPASFMEADGLSPTAQAVASERRRIAQDLHDSIGSHLIGLLARHDMRNPGEKAIALGLEEALLELRLVVDSFSTADEEPLPHALGRLRRRVQPALDRLGIRMHWNVSADEACDRLAHSQSTELVRIAQEALSNVMRHSGASRVEVTLVPIASTHQVLLQIQDDGRGMADSGDSASPGGRGLAGMRQRAASARGTIDISSSVGRGTTIRVCVRSLD